MDNTGKKVKVHYVGTLDDGTVFDSSKDRNEPLEFTCMTGQMIPGFDKAVVDMEIGETKTVHLEPEEAYGERVEEAVRSFPIDSFANAEELTVGEEILLRGPNGMPMQATVADKTDTEVTLDMNHPMAGKALNFEVTLLDSE